MRPARRLVVFVLLGCVFALALETVYVTRAHDRRPHDDGGAGELTAHADDLTMSGGAPCRVAAPSTLARVKTAAGGAWHGVTASASSDRALTGAPPRAECTPRYRRFRVLRI